MTSHLVERARKPFNAAIKDAEMTIAQIDEVVMVAAQPGCHDPEPGP